MFTEFKYVQLALYFSPYLLSLFLLQIRDIDITTTVYFQVI